jgi:hypothetical protein
VQLNCGYLLVSLHMKTKLSLILMLVHICLFGQNKWILEKTIWRDSINYLHKATLVDSNENELETRTFIKNTLNLESWSSKTVSNYDSRGLLKSKEYYFVEGLIPLRKIVEYYVYNDDDYKKSIERYQIGISDSILAQELSFEYVQDSLISAMIITEYVGFSEEEIEPITYRIELLHDRAGREIEEWRIDEEGNRFMHYSKKYDRKGNLIEKRLLDELEFLEKSLWKYDYDKTNKLKEDRIYFNNGELFRKHSYQYDGEGNLIKMLEFGGRSKEPLFGIEYEYQK